MVSERLKNLRKERGVTQKEVAEKAGVIERQYQNYEYGKIKPSHDALIALADFFNVSIDYLVGRTDRQEVNR